MKILPVEQVAAMRAALPRHALKGSGVDQLSVHEGCAVLARAELHTYCKDCSSTSMAKQLYTGTDTDRAVSTASSHAVATGHRPAVSTKIVFIFSKEEPA